MLRAAARLRFGAGAGAGPGPGPGPGRGVRGRGTGPGDGDGPHPPPDGRIHPELLACLVCPLSRRRLRYEESTNQLINDELGIAYPIVDGIPNMIPQEARLIRKSEDGSKEEESSQQ